MAALEDFGMISAAFGVQRLNDELYSVTMGEAGRLLVVWLVSQDEVDRSNVRFCMYQDFGQGSRLKTENLRNMYPRAG